MKKSDGEKCEIILDEMDSILTDIRMQWDMRHYTSLSVIRKIERLKDSILDFNFFYRRYVEQCEKEFGSIKDIEVYLKEND